MSDKIRWEGPARLILEGSLTFRASASLWFDRERWGGILQVARAPAAKDLERMTLELELAEVGRVDIDVVGVAEGVERGDETVAVLRFDGVTPMEWPPPQTFR